MLLPLLLCIPLSDVQGLEEGESARVLPPAPSNLTNDPQPLHRYESGLVICAFSGIPLQGATVEAWTEEITVQSGGFRRVGETRTDAAGHARVRIRDGGLTAEKLRVSHTGYMSFSGTKGDLEDHVYLVPMDPEPPVLEVVDVYGRPLEGARITTTYSCAHDLPAFEERTDLFGRATLREYGYQNHHGELRVRAPGYRAIKYYDEVLAPAHGGVDRVMLVRAPKQRATLLRPNGKPYANTPVWVQDGDGYHVVTTKKDGRFEVEERYDGEDFTTRVIEDGKDTFVYVGPMPWRVAPKIAPHDRAEFLEDLPKGTIRVEGTEGLYYFLFHESGFTTDGKVGDEAHECPEGQATIVYGSPFSEEQPGEVRVRIKADEASLVRLLPEAPLWVRILVEDPDETTVWLQAGEDAIEVEGNTTVPVPLHDNLVVVALGDDARRAILKAEPYRGDLGTEDAPAVTLDLRRDEYIVDGLLPDPPADLEDPVVVTVLVLDDSSQPIAGELDVYGTSYSEVEKIEAGKYRFTCGRGERLTLSFYADDHSPTGLHWIAREDVTLQLNAMRLGSIEIDCDEPFRLEEPYSGGLDQVHPGHVRPVMVFENGIRLGLDLIVEPGESRKLTVER